MCPVIPSDTFCSPGFRSYGNLENKGATIVWGDFSEGVGKLIPEGESFDYVFDNYAKDVDTCKDLAACAKAWYVQFRAAFAVYIINIQRVLLRHLSWS